MIKKLKKYKLKKKKKKLGKKRSYKTKKQKYIQITNFYNSLQNPEKYCGKVKIVEMRSSYEINYAIKLDNSPNVVQWSSEDIIIRYKGLDNKWHRYYTDFYIKLKNGQEYIIEVKPKFQTIEPQRANCKSDIVYKRAMFTYLTNQAKWDATKEYCKEQRKKGRKIYFRVLTETDLIKEEII